MIRTPILAAGLIAAAQPQGAAGQQPAPSELRAASSFAAIASAPERSVALFAEAGKVLLHPRCVNCHPAGDRPLQGDDQRPHQPPVARGPDGHGVPGLECRSCHGAANSDLAHMPGHPDWHLAPSGMAWQGLTLGQICEQIKDPARNGGKTVAEIVRHMGMTPLVGWSWSPGAGRTPAPGTQRAFGALLAAWADTGAVCPPS